MDDRGRLAQSLTGAARQGSPLSARACAPVARGADDRLPSRDAISSEIDLSNSCGRTGDAPARRNRRSRPMLLLDRWAWLLERRLSRARGSIATSIVLLSSLAYGVVKGEHLPGIAGYLKDGRDWVANTAGLR